MPSDLSSWMSSPSPPSKDSPRKELYKPNITSLLTRILKHIGDGPIRPTEYPRAPTDGPPGVLLEIDYQGDAGVAKLKLYDTTKGEIYEWQDITGHLPYCLTDLPRDELSQRSNVVGHSGFLKLETTKKYNLLLDREQEYTVVVAKDPLAIGGRPDSIREKLGREHSWEADIRYTHCYAMDRALTPGLLYRVQNGRLAPMPQEFSTHDANKIRKLFKKGTELAQLIEEYLPLFLTHATYLPRLALDIEVESEFIDRIPDPEAAEQPVISVAVVDDSGYGRVLLLRRRGIEEESKPKVPDSVKVEFFDDERRLLERVFAILWRTPLLLTFNGDNFDLRYLVNRAKKLNIPPADIPIRLRGGFRGNPEADLDYGVHVDLYRFFHNRSIQIYAFSNQYQEVRLETISQALLGEGKLELPKEIKQLPLNLLVEYNWQDADLTIRLTQFDSDLVMNLILLLMRLCHQGMHDLTRTAVSNWIRSLLYYAHRQRNFLIPRQDEIANLKGEATTEAIIKGKKYMGAIVVDPKEGVHFNVTVLDFACFSEDTEVLTSEGWYSLEKLKTAMNKGVFPKIASVNQKTGKVEFESLTKIHEYDYEGQMYHFNTRGVDLLVTPNHRIVFQRRTTDRKKMEWRTTLEIDEANDLVKKDWYRIPHFGTWIGKEKSIKIGEFEFKPQNFLPFLGWLLTAGTIKNRNITIYQSKTQHFEHIRISLTMLGFPFKENEYKSGLGHKYTIFCINNAKFARALKAWLSNEVYNGKKGIPRSVLNLDRKHLKLLFDAMTRGDGSWIDGKCHSISSTSKNMIDDFQELALRLGYGCSIKKEESDCQAFDKSYPAHVSYRAFLSYNRKNVFSGQHPAVSKQDYVGRVWCVSVPNGIVIVRRNGKTAVTGNSLYPSIMKAYNLSYETVRCNHPECHSNTVPGTPHWVCTRREGLTSLIIGLIRDVRVEHFKPHAKDHTLPEPQRSWFSVVEQALKVFANACLPFDEEVIVRTSTNQVFKRTLASLKNEWSNYEILSVNTSSNNGLFGTPIFVPIKGLAATGIAKILQIQLADGRLLRCTNNHVVPMYSTGTGRKYGKTFKILEVPASELKVGDELLLCSQLPLTKSPPECLFIPDVIDSPHLLIGMKRSTYKRFSYKRNQSTDNALIQIINQKFSYSKVSKLYKTYWSDLSEEEKDIIRKTKSNLLLVKLAKANVSSGQWQRIFIPLTNDFIQLLGWYIAEGHSQRNRLNITQSIKKKPKNVREIIHILEKLNWPHAFKGDKSIVVHSNVLSAVIGALCGTNARSKRIPLFLLNEERAQMLLEAYFKGDGSINLRGVRRYTTVSPQLIRDLVFLLSATRKFISLHRDSDVTRIVETSGKQYTRKYQGLMEFHGTNLVRVKSIITEPEMQPVFDVETENGWFVTTNGIVTHNSYGVLGASHFPLYCAPAAESITALGRFAITETIKKAKALGVVVLYGDTDSLFLENPSEEQLRQLIEYSEQELRVELDVEKEYRYVALSSRKKNYLGVSEDGHVDIKGLTGKKRNTPAFLQDAFMQMIEILRQVRDPDGFDLAKEQILKLARTNLTMLERREFAVEDLAIRVQLTKSLEAYTKTTPQHVKAAKQLQEAGHEIKAGDIIAFVKTSGGVKPVEQATVQDVDTTKYKELVKSTFEQVLDALGIEWFDTIGMRTLDTFFG